MSEPTSIAALAADLAKLGVAPGDHVMVHASLRRIGPVERGAEGVIEALDRAVGPGGTLLMVLGARDDRAWVNDRPEGERAALLAGSPPFDALTTPAQPDVGVLAEVFRRTPGTRVSDHPEGRFAARGLLDRHLLIDVPWHDYYGPDSPLERLVNARGKVLRLGADPNTVTLIHHAEYLADVPNKRRVRRHRLVATPRGPELRVVECLDDNAGIVEYPGGDYFGDILHAYLDLDSSRDPARVPLGAEDPARGDFVPRVRRGLVGRAHSELLDAGDLVRFAAGWMTERFRRR